MDEDRSASLLVRVWIEHGTEFRARLTYVDTSLDAASRQEVDMGLASTPGDVLTRVGAWLSEFVSSAPGEPDGTA
jgi:hypothetical protein